MVTVVSCSARCAAKATCSFPGRQQMFDSVRLRLTLWYVGVLGLILVAFSIGLYILIARDLDDRLDAGLRSSLETIAAASQHPGATGELSSEALNKVLQELHFPNLAIAI